MIENKFSSEDFLAKYSQYFSPGSQFRFSNNKSSLYNFERSCPFYMKEEKKHFWLYVLRLEQGKYYVGITSRKNPNQRIEEHMHGFYSAQWVKKYKPIEPIEIIDLGNISLFQAESLELEQTLQYMKKYGYRNVRGGKLNYSGRYIKIFSRLWRFEDFMFMLGTIIMLLALVVLFFKAY